VEVKANNDYADPPKWVIANPPNLPGLEEPKPQNEENKE